MGNVERQELVLDLVLGVENGFGYGILEVAVCVMLDPTYSLGFN